MGLLFRLVMLALVVPHAASQWYVPFLEITTKHFTLDPWKVFLAAGGTDIAFPYGYAMWLMFLPLSILCNLLGIENYIGYGLTLLVADIGLLFILRALFQTQYRLLLVTYWLSPIILFATYWLGFNDLIPVTLLCIALYFVRHLKIIYAGIFCSLAISAKFSMILALPFFCIYLFRNKSFRHLLPTYVMGLVITAALLGLPFIFSNEGMHMLIHNPEMGKVYQLVLSVGGNTVIYLIPMIYLLMLYISWHVRRINFQLLNTLFGLSFFLIVLLTPASFGWFIWIIPLLILYQTKRGNAAIMLVSGFTTLYVITGFLTTPVPSINGSDMASRIVLVLNNWLGPNGGVFLHTILFTLGVILVSRIWHELIGTNDYFRLSRKPFVIGIAGDSGAGKDTLTSSLKGLFGNHSVVTLSGDDYHLWDRQKPMWQVMTHLNPRANNLEQYAEDLISLSNGKAIHLRHYDHDSGKRMRPHRLQSNDFIIANGLHALYFPLLRSCYDLKIYLDIDEGLRRHFKLQRDVSIRGHSIEKVLFSLDKRDEDSRKFVRPQAAHADLVLSLQPIHPSVFENRDNDRPLRFKLFVRSKRGLNEESLLKVLIGICGLHVDIKMGTDNNEVELTIEGETVAEDIALAAKTLLPHMYDFLDIVPRWEGGIRGLMQLVVLCHINQSLSERLI